MDASVRLSTTPKSSLDASVRLSRESKRFLAASVTLADASVSRLDTPERFSDAPVDFAREFARFSAALGALTPAPVSLLERSTSLSDAGGKPYLPFGDDTDKNYEPTTLPVAVGGYFWVVFTSRREYGNTINDPDPWEGLFEGGVPAKRKKLWVAAIDIDNPEHPSASAHDISHPPFYLEGQELEGGNSRGFWALSPCESNGMDCISGDQCCSGFCRQTTGPDGGTVLACVAPPMGCANQFEKCSVDSDCCACPGGAQTRCIADHCACLGAQ